MEQQSLFDSRAFKDAAQEERALYERWKPVISEACREFGLPQDRFSFQENKGDYSSIYFGSTLIARLRIRGRVRYISVAGSWRDDLPLGLSTSRQKDGRLRIQAVDADKPETVRAIMSAMVRHFPKEYDCCSRFEKCSNAKQCVNPDRVAALGCGYRKILASGRIFYGKNRNVD